MKLMRKENERGFAYYEFKDKKGEECSIQESSFACVFEQVEDDDNDPRIWFGINHPSMKYLVEGKGWVDIKGIVTVDSYTGEEKVLTPSIFGRMELSQTQVRELIPILQKFVDEGRL